ncbi:hypothetical protein B296_00056104, partial [Ensete ventricosum]
TGRESSPDRPAAQRDLDIYDRQRNSSEAGGSSRISTGFQQASGGVQPTIPFLATSTAATVVRARRSDTCGIGDRSSSSLGRRCREEGEAWLLEMRWKLNAEAMHWKPQMGLAVEGFCYPPLYARTYVRRT